MYGWLDNLGLPAQLSSVLGLAVAMYIFKVTTESMDPAMKFWTPCLLAYAGDLIALIASQMAAAYAAVHAIEAAVHFDIGFYYIYAGSSDQGDQLGFYELLSVILFLTWALGISIVGYIEGALLWDRYVSMEVAGATMSIVDGYKYLALGMVVGMGAWISGLALGDSANKLIGFFDEYADDTDREAQYTTIDVNGDVSQPLFDVDGTAIQEDMFYHFITLLFSYATISTIAIGAYVFGYLYLGDTS